MAIHMAGIDTIITIIIAKNYQAHRWVMNKMRSLIFLLLLAIGYYAESNAISSGAIAGATIGSVAGAALLGYGIYRVVKHEQRKKSGNQFMFYNA